MAASEKTRQSNLKIGGATRLAADGRLPPATNSAPPAAPPHIPAVASSAAAAHSGSDADLPSIQVARTETAAQWLLRRQLLLCRRLKVRPALDLWRKFGSGSKRKAGYGKRHERVRARASSRMRVTSAV